MSKKGKGGRVLVTLASEFVYRTKLIKVIRQDFKGGSVGLSVRPSNHQAK